MENEQRYMIEISEEVGSSNEAVTLLQEICAQIANGCTSGYYPHWNLKQLEDNKE